MEFRKLIDNLPSACAVPSSLVGGIGFAAVDLYVSYKCGLVPNAFGAFVAGATFGAGVGGFTGWYIKRKLLEQYEPQNQLQSCD